MPSSLARGTLASLAVVLALGLLLTRQQAQRPGAASVRSPAASAEEPLPHHRQQRPQHHRPQQHTVPPASISTNGSSPAAAHAPVASGPPRRALPPPPKQRDAAVNASPTPGEQQLDEAEPIFAVLLPGQADLQAAEKERAVPLLDPAALAAAAAAPAPAPPPPQQQQQGTAAQDGGLVHYEEDYGAGAAPPGALAPRASPLPASNLTVDVWVLAGQSNMVGENAYDGEQPPHPLSDPWPGRLLAFPNSTGAWQDAEENMHALAGGCFTGPCRSGVGPAMAFGRTLIEQGLSHRVGFVPTACGGSSLAWDWTAGTGRRYIHMIDTTRRAMRAALPGGRGAAAQLRGVLWVQGESDGSRLVGGDGQHARAYGRNLQALVAAARAELREWHPLLPFVVVKMSVAGRLGALPWVGDVRRAQEEVAAAVPAVVAADMEGLQHFTADLGKDLGGVTAMHLTKQGACALGLQMAQRYAESGQARIRPGEPPR